MFDTHCHLQFDAFKERVGSVIDDARDVGVERFLIPSIDLEDSKKVMELANDYFNVYAAIGLHPTEDLEQIDVDKLLQTLEELSENEKVVAIGEIGLDYYRHKAPSSVQQKFYSEQIKLAARLDKAIIIHNRQATEDVIDNLEANWSPHMQGRIVYHCCPADDSLLEHALKRNIYIGVDGDVTYDKTKAEFIKKVPTELLVLETDSPFLTPEPIRKSRKFPNEPKNLTYIVDKIADIKKVKTSEVSQITNENAMNLFGLRP